MQAEVTLLGTGTSTGVPMLGCRCETCTSQDSRDQRLRASALVRWQNRCAVIDTTPEFRLQLLREKVRSLDAVLLTHHHADHINGFDDLRQFTFKTADPIPVYGSPSALAGIRHQFNYIWEATQVGGGLPKVRLIPVRRAFSIHGLQVAPVPVKHGCLTVYGYRIGDLAYISDVSHIPDESHPLLDGIRTLIIDAVRYRHHSTHFNLEEALAAARRIGSERTILTHLNHNFLHGKLAEELPDGVEPGRDGLRVTATV